MKKTLNTATFLAATIFISTAANATKLERGREGLTEIAFSVTNSGAEALVCGATLAHWYSQPVGTVAPGATISSTLWLQLETGTVFLLNQIEDRMPVERLWCGREGASWKTRSEVVLERRKGESLKAVRLTCKITEGNTKCARE